MKQEFRRFCLSQSKFNRYYYSKIIEKELYKIAKNYKNILFFIPLKDEVDIHPLLKRLRKEGKNIFVPFMEGLSFKMVKYSLPLKKKKFSILEPINKQKTLSKIDLAIVPIVGIDYDFKRVGFGKGMYDRFFDSLKYRPKVVFVQLRPCIYKGKITDFYDIKGDEFVSFKVRRKNDNRNYSRFFFISSRGFSYSKKT
jgi:5-formyltetrahydrofolate cyclo-ligase